MRKSNRLNFFVAVFLTAFVVVVSGCKSAPIYLDESAPVVIFSVISNPRTPWDAESANANANNDDDYDETGSGLLSNLVGKITDKNNVEVITAQDRVDYAAQALNELFPITANIEVVSHDNLLEAPSYKRLGTNFLNYLEATAVATGYINNMQLGAKDARMIMNEIGAKGLVMADFTFQKTLIRGSTWNGEMAAKVKMKVRFLNSEGRAVVEREFVAISSENIQIQKRRYNREQFVDSFQPTIDAVINQFLISYIR